jgi:hypothetical protein
LLRTKNKKLKPKPGRLPDDLRSERVSGRGQGVELAAGAAKDEFSITLRTYWPNGEVLDGHWAPPPAVLAN